MNVLVVAPHPDDEAIGCGGAISLHVGRGDRVAVTFLTSGELGLKHLPVAEAWRVREAEAEAAAEVLGAASLSFLRRPDWNVGVDAKGSARLLGAVLGREMPELVYLPHPGEWHPDHQASLPVMQEAMLHAEIDPPSLALYEVWTPLPAFDWVEDVTPVMGRKLRAVRCYTSQIAHFRYDRAARGLAQYRGELAGRCRYAEVFQSSNLPTTE